MTVVAPKEEGGDMGLRMEDVYLELQKLSVGARPTLLLYFSTLFSCALRSRRHLAYISKHLFLISSTAALIQQQVHDDKPQSSS